MGNWLHFKVILPISACSQWCPFFHWGCVWVWHSHSQSVAALLYCIRSGVIRCTLFMVRFTCGALARPSRVPGLGVRPWCKVETRRLKSNFPTLCFLNYNFYRKIFMNSFTWNAYMFYLKWTETWYYFKHNLYIKLIFI